MLYDRTARQLGAAAVAALLAAVAGPELALAESQQHRFSSPQNAPDSAAASGYAASSKWAPKSVSSTVQLGGSLTRSSATYSLERDDSKTNDVWAFGVQGTVGSWVEATAGKGADKRKLDVSIPAGRAQDMTLYTIDLSSESAPSVPVTVSTVQSRQTVPHPAKLSQNVDALFFLWTSDLLASLAALPANQRKQIREVKVRVKTPTPKLLNLATPEGFEAHHPAGSATLTFTSKPGVDFSTLPPQIVRVHFQQPEAVASIRKLDRTIELSHWGNNLAIQDEMELYNAGPELEGHFARIDYQKAGMMRRQGIAAIPSLSLSLPGSASNPYYYDIVGNVSTSNFRAPAKAALPSQRSAQKPAVLELKPRYPLFGGWNYSFTIGYDLPLGEYVRTRKGEGRGQYIAAVPFLTPIKDVAVEHARIEIRLPEGARNIKVLTPFPYSTLSYPAFVPRLLGKHETVQQGGSVAWTYLDSTGRPTVVITKEDCTDMHGGDVLIEYHLPLFVEWFQKPVACASALATLFLAIALAKRIKTAIPS